MSETRLYDYRNPGLSNSSSFYPPVDNAGKTLFLWWAMVNKRGCKPVIQSIVCLLAVLVIGCSGNDPIKIGMTAVLSGRMSQLGVSARNAVHIAVLQANEQGGIKGRQLELLILDNQGDPDICAKAVQTLSEKGAAGIIGPLMSKMAQPVIDVQASYPVVVVSPTISADAVNEKDDYFFRIMPAASQEARTMAEQMNKNGHKRAAVVYDATNSAYTEPIYQVFKERHEKNGGEIIYTNDMSDPSADKFSRMAGEIISAHVDALYLIISGIDAASLTQQIRKLTSTIQFYGAYWSKTGNLIQEAGRSVEGMIIASPEEQAVKSEAYKTFADQYRQMFNSDPGFVAIYAYDAAQVLFKAIEASDQLTPDQIKASIIRLKTFEGLEETFEINGFGDTPRAMTLLTVREGKFIRSPQ